MLIEFKMNINRIWMVLMIIVNVGIILILKMINYLI